MKLLETFLVLIIIGVVQSTVTYFYWYLLNEEGQLLNGFRDWMKKLSEGKTTFRIENGKKVTTEDVKPNNALKVLFKPLGLCIYCHNVWSATAVFWLLFVFVGGLPWWGWFAVVGVSNMMLRKLQCFC